MSGSDSKTVIENSIKENEKKQKMINFALDYLMKKIKWVNEEKFMLEKFYCSTIEEEIHSDPELLGREKLKNLIETQKKLLGNCDEDESKKQNKDDVNDSLGLVLNQMKNNIGTTNVGNVSQNNPPFTPVDYQKMFYAGFSLFFEDRKNELELQNNELLVVQRDACQQALPSLQMEAVLLKDRIETMESTSRKRPNPSKPKNPAKKVGVDKKKRSSRSFHANAKSVSSTSTSGTDRSRMFPGIPLEFPSVLQPTPLDTRAPPQGKSTSNSGKREEANYSLQPVSKEMFSPPPTPMLQQGGMRHDLRPQHQRSEHQMDSADLRPNYQMNPYYFQQANVPPYENSGEYEDLEVYEHRVFFFPNPNQETIPPHQNPYIPPQEDPGHQ